MRLMANQPSALNLKSKAKIKLKITWKFLLAFFALMIVTGELHEQTHINTGRLICGDYGLRDFNAWTTATVCANASWAFLATLAGPLYSYCVMWTGALILTKAKTAAYKSLGFALVFAPLPFGRIFTALMGGGDEKTVGQALFDDYYGVTTIKIVTAIIVTAICLPPMIIAYHNIRNRYRLLYVVGFAVVPLLVLGIYVLTLLNSLLVLSASPVLGTPLLIICHFGVMLAVLITCRRWLLGIAPKGFTMS